MDKAIISVIVPVYNVKPFLGKCVESICAQTFRDLEIILVDDGSTDGSGEICDEYAGKDERIRVIHQKNAGVSAARNNGIDAASGDYLGFVDSDDWIEPNMYEILYRNLLETDADISACTYERSVDKSSEGENDAGTAYTVKNREEAMELVLKNREIGVYVWNKLYKKELFAAVRYPVGRIFEDSYVILDLLDGIERMVVTYEPKYHYVVREESITGKPYRLAEEDRIASAEKILAQAEEKYPHLLRRARRRYLSFHCLLLNKILKTAPDDYQDKQKEHRKVLRKNLGYIAFVAPEDFSFSRSAPFYVKVLFPRLYLACRKAYRMMKKTAR